jgi:hypothetical protein
MKIFFTTATLLFAISIFALPGFSRALPLSTPQWSAFTSQNDLYVTVMGDTCNHIRGGLRVPAHCDKHRSTKNGVISCTVELQLASTKMACPDGPAVARVVRIPLSETDYAPEAKGLTLRMGTDRVYVGINK